MKLLAAPIRVRLCGPGDLGVGRGGAQGRRGSRRSLPLRDALCCSSGPCRMARAHRRVDRRCPSPPGFARWRGGAASVPCGSAAAPFQLPGALFGVGVPARGEGRRGGLMGAFWPPASFRPLPSPACPCPSSAGGGRRWPAGLCRSAGLVRRGGQWPAQ